MSLTTGSLPSLINGVSQQPPTLRLPSQCDLLENGYCSIVDGVGKRMPTEHVNRLWDTSTDTPLIHLINRDEVERYLLTIQDTRPRVYNLNSGLGYVVNSTLPEYEYLRCDNPAQDLRAITIADTTFIVNRTITPAMLPDLNPDLLGYGAHVWVKQGNYATTYTLIVDKQKFTYTTSNDDITTLKTSDIAKSLAASVSHGLAAVFTTLHRDGDSTFYIHREDGLPFSIEASDTNANSDIAAFTGTVARFADLPAVARNGQSIRITGDPGSASDDYYVQFATNDGSDIGLGLWTESLAPGLPYIMDPRTLPHELVRMQDDSNGTLTKTPAAVYFVLRQASWAYRFVGDDLTNPLPSFIGQPINDIFLHRDRLGFLAGTNAVMSRSGQFYNFFRETTQTLLDSDPIDGSAATGSVIKLRHALPFNEELILFGEQSQLVLTGADLLTPKTVKIVESTKYINDEFCSPISVDNLIYFPFVNGDFSGVRDFYVDSQNNTKSSNIISAHVPRYISGRVTKIIASSTENCLVVFSDGDRSVLSLYQWRFNDQGKIQSAWSKWTFPDAKVLGGEFIGSTLHLVMARGCGQYLERIQLDRRADTDSFYLTHLDRRIDTPQFLQTVYDPTTDRTTITLPYRPDSLPTVVTEWDPDPTWKGGRILPILGLVQCPPSPPPPPLPGPPSVTIVATDPAASETGPDTATFQVRRHTDTGDYGTDLTVLLTLGGSATEGVDYSVLPTGAGTSIIIPAHSASVDITITPIADGLTEGTETVIATLASDSAYTLGSPSVATAFIEDGTIPDIDPCDGGGTPPPLGGPDFTWDTGARLEPATPDDPSAITSTGFSIDPTGLVSITWHGGIDDIGILFPAWGRITQEWDDANRIITYSLPEGSIILSTYQDSLSVLQGGTPTWYSKRFLCGSADHTISDPLDVGTMDQFDAAGFTTNTQSGVGGKAGIIPVEQLTAFIKNGYIRGRFAHIVSGSGNMNISSIDSANTIFGYTECDSAVPDPPTTLTATEDSSSSIVLTWVDASTDENGFYLERSYDGLTGWNVIATLSAGITGYTNWGLTSGTSYYYRIRAFNSFGNSDYSNVASATTSGDPPVDVNSQVIRYSTGEEYADGKYGAIDVHWNVNGASAKTHYNTNSSGWAINDEFSRWISYDNWTTETIEAANTDRNYTTNVFVGGDVNLTTLTLFGQVAVDDQLLDILINGRSTGITLTGSSEWEALTDFSLVKHFQHGDNTITFKTRNTGSPAAGNQTGLRVLWTSVRSTVSTGAPAPTEARPSDEATEALADDNAFRIETSCNCPYKIILKGNLMNRSLWVGMPYTMRYRFTPISIRTAAADGSVQAITSGRLQLRNVAVNYANTGYFRAEVTPTYRSTSTSVFAGRTAGTPNVRIGEAPFETGSFRFAVPSKSDQVQIDLVNDSFLPSWFTSADYEALHFNRITNPA